MLIFIAYYYKPLKLSIENITKLKNNFKETIRIQMFIYIIFYIIFSIVKKSKK